MIKLIKTNKNKIKPGSKSHTIYTSYKHACNNLLVTFSTDSIRHVHCSNFQYLKKSKMWPTTPRDFVLSQIILTAGLIIANYRYLLSVRKLQIICDISFKNSFISFHVWSLAGVEQSAWLRFMSTIPHSGVTEWIQTIPHLSSLPPAPGMRAGKIGMIGRKLQ